MIPILIDLAAAATAIVSVAGCLQHVAGWSALQHFRRRPLIQARALPPVTVLKPLHGDEPLLEDALASCCQQDYPDYQLVFGLQDPSDPALEVLARLKRRFPAVEIVVVVDRTRHGLNRKIDNLINMFPAARHDTLVIADSDMHVAPDYLRDLVAALQEPGAGARHHPICRQGRLARSARTTRLRTDQPCFPLPGALLARALGRQDCLGATMALSRAMLKRVGGFQALSDHLADDAVLGRLVRAQGFDVVLAATVPATTVPENHLPALFEHELRWARTVKSLEPLGFVTTAIQYPLFWAALTIGLSGGLVEAWWLFLVTWFVRGTMAYAIDRNLKVASSLTIWCLPFRDLLSMTVILASYRTRRVAWRGQGDAGQAPKPGARRMRFAL